MTAAPKRRWFLFGLSALLAVAGIACWLGYELNWIRQRQELFATGRVACEDDSGLGSSIAAGGVRAPGLLGLLGERGYEFLVIKFPNRTKSNGVEIFTPVEKAEIEDVQRLFPESVIQSYEWADPIEPADFVVGPPYDGFKL